MNDLAAALGITEDAMRVAVLVFLRIGAAMALLPAFGEQSVPQRVRLFLGLAFTVIVAPAVAGAVRDGAAAAHAFPALWISEPAIGLAFGLSLRLTIMALQIAGSIAAQSTSLSQIFSDAGSEPSPVIGQLLVVAGLALAVSLGLHLRLAEALIGTYRLFPPGTWPSASELLTWGVARISETFALAFSLAMPDVIAALVYNVALGVINRAMPALMVTFIGAPALTAGGLLLLIAALPAILHVWAGALARVLAAPF
jgi:flagellar biosynthetic protein FliR